METLRQTTPPPPRTPHAHTLVFRAACVVALLLLWAAANPMYAQTPAGTHHPAGVPDNYLITPFGYFHPSCVIELAQGDTQVDNGHAIQHQDGSITQIAPCAYPRYTAKGEKIAQGQSAQSTQQNVPSISHDWIEDYNVTTNTSFGELSADWTVPQTPTSNDGQTIFFFPGLEDINSTESILQPVLGWNANSDSAWTIASWNCCLSGTTHHSEFVPVSPSDTISGSIQSTCGAGTLSCPTWNITTTDQTTGGSTVLPNTPNDDQTFNWAFAGALEVYNVAQCSDYPMTGLITFSNLSLLDYNFNPISNPSWSFEDLYSGLTPQCAYGSGGSETATQVSLSYSNSSTPAPTYTENTIYGPSGCGPSNNAPCYVTYTAVISVAPYESLYINEAFVNGSTYNYSDTVYWGSGGCSQTYDQGEYCYGYASPAPVYAYATESGYPPSNTVTVY